MSETSESSDDGELKTIYNIPFDFNCFVVVTVGGDENAKHYTIHKDLICHYSSYFRGAFRGKFAEAKSGRLHLKEDIDEHVFDKFVRWLYSQSLPDTGKRIFDWVVELCQLYAFADFAGVPKLRMTVIDAYVEWMREKPFPTDCMNRVTNYIYSSTPTGSPLRSIIVDGYCFTLNNFDELQLTNDHDESLPAAFLLELLKRRERQVLTHWKFWQTLPQGEDLSRYCYAVGEHYDDEIMGIL